MHELALSVLLILLAAPPAGPPPTTAPVPAANRAPGMDLLERVVAAMGGAKAVDGVAQTLVLRGESTRELPGKSIASSRTTWYRFPGYSRTEVSLPSGLTSSTTFTPADAWIESPLGVLRLGDTERRSLEGNSFQNPLAVLKSRKEPGFTVELVGAGTVRGRSTRYLRLCHGDGDVTWAVDDADGRLSSARFPARSPGAKEGEIAILYSDYSRRGRPPLPSHAGGGLKRKRDPLDPSRFRRRQRADPPGDLHADGSLPRTGRGRRPACRASRVPRDPPLPARFEVENPGRKRRAPDEDVRCHGWAGSRGRAPLARRGTAGRAPWPERRPSRRVSRLCRGSTNPCHSRP